MQRFRRRCACGVDMQVAGLERVADGRVLGLASSLAVARPTTGMGMPPGKSTVAATGAI